MAQPSWTGVVDGLALSWSSGPSDDAVEDDAREGEDNKLATFAGEPANRIQ